MPAFPSQPSVAPSDPSWWFADALRQEGGLPDPPSLQGEITVDVAIIGGGFTGMWTALALKKRRPQITVALIEARICGSGASGKNGGVVHGYWSALTGLTDLVGAEDRQADLFFRPNEKAERGMAVLDKINAKFGRGTLGVGTVGWRVGGAMASERRMGSKDAQWRPTLQALSPSYTTKWSDLLRVG